MVTSRMELVSSLLASVPMPASADASGCAPADAASASSLAPLPMTSE
eukprot:CAMPEP_0171201986 /NCGR_PEP_ID=MMETSP0790-20130122/24770_1 /TAXON_ID=2925 /ORGANISM="Alexandrium catenella, Strain OF101" /LENGTH=46 /DNA_ID= /DNA_START= /DNA_END= /DNA_ORIENTATION=